MNARLPEYMGRVSIKDMIVGEKAYTVPWSIVVDHEGKCWIRGDYAFTHRPTGTSRMHIKRTFYGFEVRASQGERYEQGYVSPEARLQMELLPVVKIN